MPGKINSDNIIINQPTAVTVHCVAVALLLVKAVNHGGRSEAVSGVKRSVWDCERCPVSVVSSCLQYLSVSFSSLASCYSLFPGCTVHRSSFVHHVQIKRQQRNEQRQRDVMAPSTVCEHGQLHLYISLKKTTIVKCLPFLWGRPWQLVLIRTSHEGSLMSSSLLPPLFLYSGINISYHRPVFNHQHREMILRLSTNEMRCP